MHRYKYTNATNSDGIQDLLDTMSPALRQEVANHTCKVLTTEVPYFRNCDLSFLMECAIHMEETVFAPMELAIIEGKPLTHLIIIRKGVMVGKGRVLTKGRVVGQESLYKEAPAPSNVRSMTFTDTSRLARGKLLNILKSYPKMLRSFAIKSIQVVFKCVFLSG
jgi:CRP-like cAMP-binding protein